MKDFNDKIVASAIIAGVFIFIILTGTISSGFHFTDDHEIVKLNTQLRSASVIELSKEWTSWDIKSNGRFRPFYYIHRVVEAKLFGADFMLWSIYHGIIFCGAVLLFYFGMRKLQYSITISLLMVVITFIGPQVSVLWLLGPGESLAMLFLGGAFFMIALGSVKNKTNCDILFILFLILASLTKESFLIAVPGMIFLKIWIERDHLYSTYSESLRRNYLLLIPLAVAAIELVIIKFYVGTGYAGLDKSLYGIAKNILITSLNFGKSYFNLLIALSAFVIAAIIFRVRVQLITLPSFVFLCLIILPNIILYSNYGLTERYLLPSTFALGFFVACWVSTLITNAAITKAAWLHKAVVILFLPFLPLVSDSYASAGSFTKEGKDTNELLKNLSENFNAEKPVLVVADPVRHYEMSASLMTYMKFDKNAGLYGFPIVTGDLNSSETDYLNGWKGYFYNFMFEDLKSPPRIIIFLDKELINRFFLLTGFDQNKFEKISTSDKSPFSIFKEKS